MRNFLDRFLNLNTLNLERAYKHCDDALGKLRAHNEHPGSIDKTLLDAVVEEAVGDAEKILSVKGAKAWDGCFREMHEYLAKMYMEQRKYAQAREHAQYVAEYDKIEGNYLVKQVDAYEAGHPIADFDPSKEEGDGVTE